MSRKFNFSFNPFRGLAHDELVLSYLFMSDANDHEGVALVAEAYDEDTFIDLRPFGIATRDFQ